MFLLSEELIFTQEFAFYMLGAPSIFSWNFPEFLVAYLLGLVVSSLPGSSGFTRHGLGPYSPLAETEFDRPCPDFPLPPAWIAP